MDDIACSDTSGKETPDARQHKHGPSINYGRGRGGQGRGQGGAVTSSGSSTSAEIASAAIRATVGGGFAGIAGARSTYPLRAALGVGDEDRGVGFSKYCCFVSSGDWSPAKLSSYIWWKHCKSLEGGLGEARPGRTISVIKNRRRVKSCLR